LKFNVYNRNAAIKHDRIQLTYLPDLLMCHSGPFSKDWLAKNLIIIKKIEKKVGIEYVKKSNRKQIYFKERCKSV
jgi:hypothetical protein